MLVEQEDDETVAAFKRSPTGEILTKQQRVQNNIAEYNKPLIRTDPQPNLSLIFLHHKIWEKRARKPRKANWKSTYTSIKQTC